MKLFLLLPIVFLCGIRSCFSTRFLIFSQDEFLYENIHPKKHLKKSVLICPEKLLTPLEIKLKNSLYDKVITVRNYSSSGTVETLAFHLHSENPFERIIAIDEFDILRTARLREAFRLPGQAYKNALGFRDKVKMKKSLSESGVHVPPFKSVKSASDLIEFTKIHGFPIVLKPRKEAGSEGIEVIKNQKDLEIIMHSDVFKDLTTRSSFIEGEMHHISGL